MPFRKRQLNPAEDWSFPHLFCSIMETWKHIEMVPGRQHDEITSQPPFPPLPHTGGDPCPLADEIARRKSC